jgi:hypothetical protein
VVITDLDILGLSICPAEADPPLLIDPDRALTRPVACEEFEPVAWRRTQVVQALGRVDETQVSQRDFLNVRRKTFRSFAVPDGPSFPVPKAADHRCHNV